ncbi:polyketide synthase [Fusarium beomiforme]|uniref:Polyketide synthase n=1 Tax=Fusarium beomiforme TaxID=44412 RepID=A0A9P5A4K8_9HYPO|nr:polyketide synthase [Fusarium beomiforme]
MNDHRLVLFGGQGSQSIFSQNAANTAEQDAYSTIAGSILLSKCHAAFLGEIASLDAESRKLLVIETDYFIAPRNLLRPAEEYHIHPVLQATTVYLCQVLRYLTDILEGNETFEDSFNTLEATAGFSSGMIPAALVASSPNIDDFVSSAVEGFRLAFWIACRSHFWILAISAKSANGDSNHVDPEVTLSLATRGVSKAEIEQTLRGVNAETGNQQLKVSSVSGSGSVSVSGPRRSLSLLQKKLRVIPGATTTFAFVHGWYHGGCQLEPVVLQVLEDIKRRGICLSSHAKSMKPMYSPFDGTLFDVPTASSDRLMEWLARHILIHCVNWKDASDCIAMDLESLLTEHPDAIVKIASFGPSSSSLYPTLQPSSSRVKLVDLSPFKGSRKQSSSSSDLTNDIAIVGMSAQLPKGDGTDDLWGSLCQGINAVQEIPESRFKLSDFYMHNPEKPRFMSTKYGAFINDPFSFDNTFFNISPREAKSMDPQQRILLHVAQGALEDAGYVPDSTPSFQRATMGCWIGLATGDYTDSLRNDIDTFYSPGTLRSFHSGRISYFYRLSGPSIVTDTACSSSTVSIYQACRALQNGDCTAAIAGGVNIITSPDMYLGLSRGHFLSPTGNCKPFDAAADGYCRAEGCVLFVLKRLSDAIAERDHIHGVIRSAQINQSGNSSSITHPHSPTQTDLLKKLLDQAKVGPESVGVIEAHGTGTQAGDAREVETLKRVFGPHHSPANPLFVTSIKGNIGHCEAASGAAGLVKLLLMFRENEIPCQVGLNNLNPALGDLDSVGLIIPRRNIEWKRSVGVPRRAVLNNFGAAGSNASLLIEEWMGKSSSQRSEPEKTQSRSSYVFVLSAKSEKAIRSSLNRYISFLTEQPGPSLEDICYTATARRQHYDHRISMTCASEPELLTKLQNYRIRESQPARRVSSTVFVFTGQGALYGGMGEELMNTYPPFKDIITSCDRILQGLQLSCPSILNYIMSNRQAQLDSLNYVEHLMVAQCACIALEYALAQMFISLGVKPDYVMGHSLGEYAALCVSGVLSLEDCFRVVASRARMMGQLCLAETSGMLACHMTADQSQEMIWQDPPLELLTLACLNGPQDCVIGGPLSQLEVLQTRCKAGTIRSKVINVPYAFHTSYMDPIMEPLRELGKSIKFKDATIPIVSNMDGRLCNNDFNTNYFANHTRQPVRFRDGILNLQKVIGSPFLDDSIFIEIGPHPALLPMLRDSISSNSCTLISTLQKGRDAWFSIAQTLATLSLRKVTIDWRQVFVGTSAQVTSLPGHPLEGSKFYVPYQEPREITNSSDGDICLDASRVRTQHSLLPWLRTNKSPAQELVFETDMAILGPLISGHDVGGTPICPASLFHELALQAGQTFLEPPESNVLVITGMSFSSPLVHMPSMPSQSDGISVLVYITKQLDSDATSASFRITSLSKVETLHCSGSVSSQNANPTQWMKDHALFTRQSRYFSGVGKEQMSSFRAKVLYETIFTRVVRYSADYQSLQFLNVADSNLEGIGSFRIPGGDRTYNHSVSKPSYVAHPVFTDTLLHAAGFIANLAVGSRDICICSGVESIEVAYSQLDYQDSFQIYCNLLEIKGAILADAIALDSSGRVVAVVRGMEFKKLHLATFQQALSRMPSAGAVEPRIAEILPKPARLPPLLTPTRIETLRTRNPTDLPTQAKVEGGFPVSVEKGWGQVLREVVTEVGGFTESDIDYTMSLSDLGIDSMMQIEITSKLSRLFPGKIGLTHHALSECETLQEMESMLSSSLQVSGKQQSNQMYVDDADICRASTSQSTEAVTPTYSGASDPLDTMTGSQILPVTLHLSDGMRTPLCLFHDGSGQVNMYKRLRGYDRTCYAFFDPHFGISGDKRVFYSSVTEMAEHYVSMIISNGAAQPFPLILGAYLPGWSFGGIVAFEAAQLLTNRGFEVKGLVMIDSPCPVDHDPLPAEVIASISSSNSQKRSVSSALEEEFMSNAVLLGIYKPVSFPQATGRGLKTVMLMSQDLFDTEALCGVRYDWLSKRDTRYTAIGSWEELVGGHVEVLPIPGNHFQPFLDGMIDRTSAQLWEACRIIEEPQTLNT